MSNQKTSSFFFLFLFSMLSIGTELSAQDAITSANGTLKTEDIIIDWTIGEIATVSLKDADVDVTQGFHQPELICFPCDDIEHDYEEFVIDAQPSSNSTEINIYPNPAHQFVNVQFNIPESSLTYLGIYNQHGQLMMLQQMNNRSHDKSDIKINIDSFATGQYYLRIYNDNFSEIKSFQIIK